MCFDMAYAPLLNSVMLCHFLSQILAQLVPFLWCQVRLKCLTTKTVFIIMHKIVCNAKSKYCIHALQHNVSKRMSYCSVYRSLLCHLAVEECHQPVISLNFFLNVEPQ